MPKRNGYTVERILRHVQYAYVQPRRGEVRHK